MNDAPPNNPLKEPSYKCGAVVAAALLIAGVVLGQWLLIILGAVGVLSGLAALLAIRRDRNPWWTRSPLDYWHRRKSGPRR
jgi:hypothetical protein